MTSNTSNDNLFKKSNLLLQKYLNLKNLVSPKGIKLRKIILTNYIQLIKNDIEFAYKNDIFYTFIWKKLIYKPIKFLQQILNYNNQKNYKKIRSYFIEFLLHSKRIILNIKNLMLRNTDLNQANVIHQSNKVEQEQ